MNRQWKNVDLFLEEETDLRQRSEALLLDVPDELVARELQALLHVQLGHVHANQQPALALPALTLHFSTTSVKEQKWTLISR